MAQRVENRSIDDAVELLKENGFDGLAEAVTILMNSAMVAERSEYLCAAPYERSFDDVFEMQRAIATGIAEAIRTELGIKDTYDFMMQSRRAQTISQESKLARM